MSTLVEMCDVSECMNTDEEQLFTVSLEASNYLIENFKYIIDHRFRVEHLCDDCVKMLNEDNEVLVDDGYGDIVLANFVLKWDNQDCWIAPWDGDPGRTTKIINAQTFTTREKAEEALEKLKKENSHRKMNIVVEEKIRF